MCYHLHESELKKYLAVFSFLNDMMMSMIATVSTSMITTDINNRY